MTACGWNPVQATTDCDWDRNCPVHGENPTVPATVATVGALPVPGGNRSTSTAIDSFLAAISGGDLPADAVREERCIKAPIGCGKPLISEDGSARVFWDEEEAARYQAEWHITGLCPDCQDRIEAGEDL